MTKLIKHKPLVFPETMTERGYSDHGDFLMLKWFGVAVLIFISLFIVLPFSWIPLIASNWGFLVWVGVWLALDLAWFKYCNWHNKYNYLTLGRIRSNALESYWKLDYDTAARFPDFERMIVDCSDGQAMTLAYEMDQLLSEQLKIKAKPFPDVSDLVERIRTERQIHKEVYRELA